MQIKHIFLLTLFVALSVHGIYWNHLNDSVDRQAWAKEVADFKNKELWAGRDSIFYGYPATVILMTAWVAQEFGVAPVDALVGSVALLISIPVAAATTLCYILRPKSWWWLGAGGLMIFNHLYYEATPPSAVVMPFIVLIMLCVLYFFEQAKVKIWQPLILGLIAGTAAAVRLDVATAVMLFAMIFLAHRWRWKILIIPVAAGLAFVVFDPYMWLFPLYHLRDIAGKVFYHYANKQSGGVSLIGLVTLSPLAFISFLICIYLAAWPRLKVQLLPRVFLWFAVLFALGLSVIIFNAQFHPSWYFYPLILFFEILLPLYLLALTQRMSVFIRTAQIVILTLLVGGCALLFFIT